MGIKANSGKSTSNGGSPVKRTRNRNAKWAYLLDEDPNFNRWYKNMELGSTYTARERARVLYRFLRRYDMTPQSLAEFARKDLPEVREVEDFLMDFVSELTDEGKAPTYILSYITSVKSWLTWNGVRLIRKIKVGNTNVAPTIENERVPTPSELGQILGYASIRGRCSIALMAFSGVRPEVLGNLDGTDGLKVRDFPEMSISEGRVTFSKIPTRFIIRHSLSKAKHKYMTFLTAEGCGYLKAYLEWRMANGVKLTQDSSILSITPGQKGTGVWDSSDSNRHIVTGTITNDIRKAMRPRFQWRPYVLRCYFDTQLLLAENNRKMSHSYRVFFMGHTGDMEARYTTNKGKLPEQMIEDMRRAFMQAEEYLSTAVPKDQDAILVEQALLLAAQVLSPEKVAMIKEIYSRMPFKEAIPHVREVWKKKLETCIAENEEEYMALRAEGWERDTTLEDGRIFMVRD